MAEWVKVSPFPRREFPSEFTWRGRRHRVQRIEKFTLENERGRQGLVRRKLFQLRTQKGIRCVLSLEVGQDRWRIERVLQNTGGD